MSLFEVIRKPNGRQQIYLGGIKIFSYRKGYSRKYTRLYSKHFGNWSEAEMRFLLKEQFKKNTGYSLNLDTPKTFNEKLQWLKLYYQDSLMTKCADKVGVREYIKEKIGAEYLVPVIGIYDSADEIEFDKLPDKFVMKVNWGSGQNIVVTDKSKLDIDNAKSRLTEWMELKNNHYYNFFEWPYKNISPKIIIEEYLDFTEDLVDYKVMCYNGEPKNLFTCSERNSDLKVTFFDLNWQKLPFTRKYKASSVELSKPEHLDEMLKISKTLAEPFPFARIDFYCVKNKLYVGEITFFPGSGHEKFKPFEWDVKLGDLLKLPEKKQANEMILNDVLVQGEKAKNVILIWPKANAFEALMADPNVYIPVLIDNGISKELLNKYRHRIGRIYCMYPSDYKTFFQMTETDYLLNEDDIQKYMRAQFKVERFMNRHLEDLAEIDYRYYHCLAFWLGIFKQYKIDCVMSDRVEHGDLNDVILYEIAKNNHVPCYIVSVEYANTTCGAFSLVRLTDNASEKLRLDNFDHPKLNASNYIFNKECQNRVPLSKREIKKAQKKLEHKLIKNVKKYSRKLRFLKNVDKFKFLTDGYQSWDRPTPIKKLDDYTYVNQLKNMYAAVSENIVEGEKFVFYALHFEPEASILNRVKLNNQLYNIKMLAKSLPEGWKLYVKEHPMQFAFGNPGITYCLNHVNYYRSLEFYAQIKRLDNVRIINIDTPSNDLIERCQAAATINGTVRVEAISRNKPLIIFCQNTAMESLLKDTFVVKDYSQLEPIMKKIKEGFVPQYDDFQKVAEIYLFELEHYMSNEKDDKKIAFYSKLYSFILKDAAAYKEQFR